MNQEPEELALKFRISSIEQLAGLFNQGVKLIG